MSKPDEQSEQPEQPVFFLDRGLGSKIVPELLRKAGFQVVTMQEVFGRSAAEEAADEIWIPRAAEMSMAILMKDTAVRFEPLERQAVVSSGARCFALARADLTGPEMARRFIVNFDAIIMAAATRSGPYFFHVHADRIEEMRLLDC